MSRPTARLAESLRIAAEAGVLDEPKAVQLRVRVPRRLIERASARTGIAETSALVRAALAHLAFEDDFGEWLVSRKGSVDPALDLEP